MIGPSRPLTQKEMMNQIIQKVSQNLKHTMGSGKNSEQALAAVEAMVGADEIEDPLKDFKGE